MELRLCASCGLALAPGSERAPGCTREPCEPTIRIKSPRWLVGQRFGPYRIDALIGSGGMGAVFRATHEGLNRAVALKVLAPDFELETKLGLFQREAKLLAELDHPHIVRVHDCAIAPVGLAYLVMELVEGETLAQWIASWPHGAPIERWLPIASAMGDALAHAHAHGVIHRDLKPDNVMLGLDPPRTLKLLDFGISKALPAATRTQTPTLAGTGVMLGTPAYAAPEQLAGESVSAATDQYALALVCAELISGRPWRDPNATPLELLRCSLRGALEVRELNTREPVRAALERALAADPAARFASVSAFLGALEGSDSVTPAPPTRRMGAPVSEPRGGRKRWRAAALITLAAVLLGALWMALLLRAPNDSALLHPLKPHQSLRAFADDATKSLGIDALAVLGHDAASGQALLRTSSGFGAIGLNAAALPTLVSPKPVQRFLASAERGASGASLAAIDERGVLRWWSVDGQSSDAVIDGLAPAARCTIDFSGAFALCVDEERVEWLALNGAVRRETLTAWRDGRIAGDRLVGVDRAGRLQVSALADPTAVLTTGHTVSTLREASALPGLALIALLDGAERILIVDVLSQRTVADLTINGDPLALQWVPDAPSLLIVGRFGVQRWRPNEGLAALNDGAASDDRFSDARFLINPNYLGLLALDRSRGALKSYDYGQTPVASLGPTLHHHWSRSFVGARDVVYRSYADGLIERVDGARVRSVQAHSADPQQLLEIGTALFSASAEPLLKRFATASLTPNGERAFPGSRIVGLERATENLQVIQADGRVSTLDPNTLAVLATDQIRIAGAAADIVSVSFAESINTHALRLADGRVCMRRSSETARCTRPDASPLGRLTALGNSGYALLRQVDSRRLLLLDLRAPALFELPLFAAMSRNVAVVDDEQFYVATLGMLLNYRLTRTADGLRVAVRGEVRTDLFYDSVAWRPSSRTLLTGWRQREGFRAAILAADALSTRLVQDQALVPLPLPFE
jgi:serine/threonine protein kinase